MDTRVLYPVMALFLVVVGIHPMAAIATDNPCPEPDVRVEKLLEIVQRLEGIPFDSNPQALQDSSGIFHQVVQQYRELCSSQPLPNHIENRSTRLIGDWYHQRGAFTPIVDPLEQAELIQPGMVMFYGVKRSPNMGKGMTSSVSRPEDDSTAETIMRIRHIGIVVGTEMDDRGILNRYHLFNGRRPGKVSKVTKYHYRVSRSYPDFPYGNGSQNWIGIAPFWVDFEKPDAASVESQPQLPLRQ